MGAGSASEAVKQSFNNMRIIVSLGWAIYPAGYFLGQINDSAGATQALNVTYNIADFVNKSPLCWHAGLALRPTRKLRSTPRRNHSFLKLIRLRNLRRDELGR